jgi:hypothetical protein
MDITHELIVKAAEELNTVLVLKPIINTSLKDDILLKLIDKICPLLEEYDDFSDDVMRLLLQCPSITENISSVFEMKIAFDENPEVLDTAKTNKEIVDEDIGKPGRRKRKPHMLRLEELISEGRYTASDIISIIISEFPDLKKQTVANYIRSSKSKKYTTYTHAAIEDISGILRFDETVD